MRIIKKVFPFVVILLFTFGCLSEKPDETAAEDQPKLHDPSELAIEMRQMHEEAKAIRHQILNGTFSGNLTSREEALFTATPTDPAMKKSTYDAHALYFEQVVNRVNASEEDSVRSAFNNLVDACITCHKDHCQGPIPAIKKLRLD